MARMEDPTQVPEFEVKDAGFGRSTEVQDQDAPREPAGITEQHDRHDSEGDQR